MAAIERTVEAVSPTAASHTCVSKLVRSTGGSPAAAPRPMPASAARAAARSAPMLQARGMWEALKPAALTPLFESADVDEGQARNAKRPRR